MQTGRQQVQLAEPPIEAAIETVAFLRLRAPDVQAALTVLGRDRFAR